MTGALTEQEYFQACVLLGYKGFGRLPSRNEKVLLEGPIDLTRFLDSVRVCPTEVMTSDNIRILMKNIITQWSSE